MGFPILVRWHLYIESGPWLLYQWTTKAKLILFFGLDTRHRGQGIPLIMRKIDSEINTSYSKNSRSTLKQKCCHFDEIFITGWTKDVRMASDQSCSWPAQPVAYQVEEVNVNPGLTKPPLNGIGGLTKLRLTSLVIYPICVYGTNHTCDKLVCVWVCVCVCHAIISVIREACDTCLTCQCKTVS